MSDGIQFEPVPFDEAANIIRDRPVVDQDIFAKMIPEIRARAFIISGIEDLKVAQEIRDIVAELPRGGDWDELKKQISEKLMGKGGIPWMDEEAALKRAELLLRHHGFQAYAAANYKSMFEKRDFFPYWKYLSMGDDRVRDVHAKLHGLTLPWNHAFWKDHFPPWDWGCRCQVVPVGPGEYDEMVRDGRVAGQMNLTGKINKDKKLKSRGWTLPDSGLKHLETPGRLDEGSGSTVDVSSPVKRAQKDGTTASLEAYQWNPGDLRTPVSELHEKYGNDAVLKAAFDAFRRNMQTAVFKDNDGLERSVWDWALSADLERAASMLAKNSAARTKELLEVVDYNTGMVIGYGSGSADRVSFLEQARRALRDGRSTAMVHNHLQPGLPSPSDLAALFRCNPAVKTIAVVEPDGKLHIVSAKMSRVAASNRRMARLLDAYMVRMDAGTMSNDEWKEIFDRLARTWRIRYETK